MKKQVKGKRTPPRRKPIRKPKAQKQSRHVSAITQDEIDYNEACERAMRERMAPEVLAEYLRIQATPLNDLSPAEFDRMDEILDAHSVEELPEVIDRHLADIVREREQSLAQDQQAETGL